MKRVLMISLAAALSVTACGDKSHLQLKAREMKDAQLKAGEKKDGTPSEKPTDGDDGILNMPTNTNNRKIPANSSATRNILLGTSGMTTTVFCSENLATAQKEKERIKLEGKSQIIVRQAVTMTIPEVDQIKKDRNEVPKSLVSLACLATPADHSKDPEDQDVTVAKLVTGKSTALVGKFSVMSLDIETTAVVTCVTAKDMAKANDLLLPEDTTKASDILMAANSKMLIQTSSKDKDLKKYILVTCEEAPAAKTPPVGDKKDVAESADVQE